MSSLARSCWGIDFAGRTVTSKVVKVVIKEDIWTLKTYRYYLRSRSQSSNHPKGYYKKDKDFCKWMKQRPTYKGEVIRDAELVQSFLLTLNPDQRLGWLSRYSCPYSSVTDDRSIVQIDRSSSPVYLGATATMVDHKEHIFPPLKPATVAEEKKEEVNGNG